MPKKEQQTEQKELTQEQFLEKVAEKVSGGLTPEIEKAVALGIEEKSKELGLDKVDRRHGMFPIDGLDEDSLKEMSKEERVAKFVKAVFRNDFFSVRAINAADPDFRVKKMTEGDDTAGGYLVPSEFRAEVLRIAESYGFVRSNARRIPMGRDTLSLPKVTGSVSVSWPGEAVAGTSSQPTFGQVNLVAKTAVGISPISNELLDDAPINIYQQLTELFGEEFAGEEDNQALNGTGQPFTGILQSSGLQTVTMGSGDTTYAKLAFEDLASVPEKVKDSARGGAAWLMHRTLFGVIRGLKDSNGLPIYNPPAEGAPGTLFGYPYILSDKMPSTSDASQTGKEFLIFGNFRKYLLLGDRQEMRMAISDQASVTDTDGSTSLKLFEQNMSAVRFTERIAINVPLASAFAVVKTAAS